MNCVAKFRALPVGLRCPSLSSLNKLTPADDYDTEIRPPTTSWTRRLPPSIPSRPVFGPSIRALISCRFHQCYPLRLACLRCSQNRRQHLEPLREGSSSIQACAKFGVSALTPRHAWGTLIESLNRTLHAQDQSSTSIERQLSGPCRA